MTIKVKMRVGQMGKAHQPVIPDPETVQRFQALKRELEAQGCTVELHILRQEKERVVQKAARNTKLCCRCHRRLNTTNHHREKPRSNNVYRRGLCNACWRKGWRFGEGGEVRHVSRS